MRYISFIIFYFISQSSFVWASETNTLHCNAPILDKFTYSGFNTDQINKFSEWICNLYQKNSIGKPLLDEIDQLLEAKNIMVTITHGAGTAFIHQVNKIEINFSQMKKPLTPCIGKRITLKPINPNIKREMGVYEIGNCMDFPENIIGHELLHMLHFLENKEEFLNFLKEDPSKRFWRDNKDPEIERRLWKTTEEKRTVLGDQRAINSDPLRFSEFEIRASWKDTSMNLPPRYAYQAHDQYFYEEAHIIEELLHDHWGEEWPAKLDFLYQQKPFESFTFDEEKAQITSLNRFKNKDYFTIQKTDEMNVLSVSMSKSHKALDTEIIKQVCNFKIEPPQENYLIAAERLRVEKKYFEAANMIIQGALTGEQSSLDDLLKNRYITQKELNSFKELDLKRLIQIKVTMFEKWKPKNLSLSDLRIIKFNTDEVIKNCNSSD